MADIDTELKTLRERVAKATERKARAQAEYERAEKDRDEALEALKEFGVSTPDEAADLLTALEAELSAALAEAQKALDEAEA
jgi:hypothetical protein